MTLKNSLCHLWVSEFLRFSGARERDQWRKIIRRQQKKVTLSGVYITLCARDHCKTLLVILSESVQITRQPMTFS